VETGHCYSFTAEEAIMLLTLVAAAAVTVSGQPNTYQCTATGRYDKGDLKEICRLERAWSQAVASGDTRGPNRALAADYVGIGSSGKRMNKAEMAAQPPRTSKFIIFSDNDYVHVRFFGNVAVNQGQDTIRTKDGHTSHLVWTDTWLKRNGKWQIVQSQDAEVEVGSPK
jgi:hypothetical protein